ncbi:glycosyltransferase [Corynebacterium xerosis]|uniref:glycosyltransferase n=1 Tax=Corynebacterium xerosis TaxID=1725 RepID=UPI001F0934AE|nr:glycosyltransferase [Corynebacterium xerosis]
MTERTRLRIAVIAPSRYPIRQPYAGGLESLVAALTAGLRAAGHDVDLFAARGSAGHVEDVEFPGVDWSGHDGPVSDSGYPPGEREKETAAFARLADHLAAGGYDVIHNNSLHPIPLTMPRPAGTALVTTLHTPPFPEMQAPIAAACLFKGTGGGSADVGHFVSVSAHTASLWTLPRPAEVVPNGVDVATWRPGPGGGPAVWFGRIFPDKAPHLAVAAARRAGVPLVLAGRIGDVDYARDVLAPEIGRSAPGSVRMVGELSHRALAGLVGCAAACLVTPEWDEPFGLVAAEAAACGTPVAAFARGGLAEVVSPAIGRTVAAGDVEGLARALHEAMDMDRAAVRAAAERDLSVTTMTRRYEAIYRRLLGEEDGGREGYGDGGGEGYGDVGGEGDALYNLRESQGAQS